MNDNHMPYDEGAVHDAFVSVLGFAPLTKTTKTMCGKRVQVSKANHVAPITCADCLAAIEQKRRDLAYLREETEKFIKSLGS